MYKKSWISFVSLVLLFLLSASYALADDNTVEVVIMYEDEQGAIISEDVIKLSPGLTVYEANDTFVPEGYTLLSQPTINIIVTSSGKASPQFIAFTYQAPEVVQQDQPSALSIPVAPVIRVGDSLQFGRYEQDNNFNNGAESISWQVIQVYNNKALLLSERNLEVLPYHNVNQPVTWEVSAMRQWLNHQFYNNAFSQQEQALVLSSYVDNPFNHVTGTYSGVDTYDHIFLLSALEVESLDISLRKAANTAYVNSKGGFNRQGYGTFWLRTAGSYEKNVAIVNYEGQIGYKGFYMRDKEYSVRPAFWLDLSKGLPQ